MTYRPVWVSRSSLTGPPGSGLINCQKSLRNLHRFICVPGLLSARVENFPFPDRVSNWRTTEITTQIYKNAFFLNKAVINNKIKLFILIAENYTQYIHFTQLTHMHTNTLTCSYQIGAIAGRSTPAISSASEDCSDTRASRQVFRKCFKWSLISTGVYVTIYMYVIYICIYVCI